MEVVEEAEERVCCAVMDWFEDLLEVVAGWPPTAAELWCMRVEALELELDWLS